jgi:hypothetical protein
VAFLPRIIVAIVIVVIAAAIAAAVKDLVGSALGGLSYGRILATTASVFIIGLGVIAALSQIGVAIAVTLPVLITVLATVGRHPRRRCRRRPHRPMRQRWEHILNRAEQEAPRAAAEARTAPASTTHRARPPPSRAPRPSRCRPRQRGRFLRPRHPLTSA